jgi:hypothetical protein
MEELPIADCRMQIGMRRGICPALLIVEGANRG